MFLFSVYGYVHMSTEALRRLGHGIRSPGVGVAGRYKVPEVVLGKSVGSSARVMCILNC